MVTFEGLELCSRLDWAPLTPESPFVLVCINLFDNV
jgi:hypothetical protein